MINTLAATVVLTCIAAEAYCIQWVIERFKRRREERRETQKAKWAAKYRKEISDRRTVRENRNKLWEMIK
ncbi:MAG: hypothetical protein K6G20_04215 [Ruminococcus sp.]|nr:hypothetical protein [Ruminococcus sp.]